MAAYAIRRLLEFVPVVLLSSIAVFMIVRLVPGDPAVVLAGPNATKQDVQQIREQLHLGGPVLPQYVTWLGDAARFDFGRSIEYKLPVVHVIRTQVESTLQLAVAAYGLAILLALPLGVLAARSRAWNYVANGVISLATGLPTFVLGLVLLTLFAAKWQVLPAGGFVSLTKDPGSAVKHLVLPAIALGLLTGSTLTRYVRTTMREVLAADYVRTARAKGLQERTVMLRHAFRNTLIPVITVVAVQVGRLIGGALIVEVVFARPGLGRLLIDGISARDYPLVQALFAMLVVVFLLVNLMADMFYGLIDPRVHTR